MHYVSAAKILHKFYCFVFCSTEPFLIGLLYPAQNVGENVLEKLCAVGGRVLAILCHDMPYKVHTHGVFMWREEKLKLKK